MCTQPLDGEVRFAGVGRPEDSSHGGARLRHTPYIVCVGAPRNTSDLFRAQFAARRPNLTIRRNCPSLHHKLV